MKTAISIPDELFEAVEQLAERQGLSRSELYVTALRKYLQEYHHQNVTEELDALYQDEADVLAPEVIYLQSCSLPREKW